MTNAINDEALETLFRAAHTHNKWQDKPVSPALLMALYDLMRWAPTAVNANPMRVTFLTSPDAKARLKPFLAAGNEAKTMSAPVTAILAYDLDFPKTLSTLCPHVPGVAGWFADPSVAEITAFRSATLQGGYFILAARALGLDCGPMSGFDGDGVDKAFFAGTNVKSNFLCNLGYGDPSGVHPRAPRLSFDEACKIL